MNLLDGINDTEDELYTFDSIIATEDKDNALEALNDLREYWLNHLPLSVKDGLKIVKVLEKELKDKENKLTIISEILVDISKGNYSDLKVAIEEIREVL